MGRQRYKKECKPLEKGDLVDTLSMAIEQTIKRQGRPATYQYNAVGLDRFIQNSIDYFDWVRDANNSDNGEMRTIPDIESWCIFLGITRTTLLEYRKRGGEWREIINYFSEIIAAAKKQLALNYRIPPIAFVFDFTNNHQYVNASEFKLEQTTQGSHALSQIEGDLLQRGIQWNESTGRYEPIRALGVDNNG